MYSYFSLVFLGFFNRIILAESPIPSPVPSDQGFPSSVAPEILVVSDTLPIISSIQPINYHAPEDESYDIHWNPVWEPSEEDIPSTPPSEESPITSKESIVTSGEIPIPMETSPFCVTPLDVTLPLRYKALRDVMGSRTPLTSSMWSHTVTPTSEPFTPQIHNVSVTSVPTIPTVCVASSAPLVGVVTASSIVTTVAGPSSESANSGPSTSTSGVVDPTLNAPPSSGFIPTGGHASNIYKLFRIRIPKARFIITILEELIFITPDLCHLNPRLSSRFRYPLLGLPPLIMVAKYPLPIFKDHLIKVSRLTCSPLTDSSIRDNLIQGNLEEPSASGGLFFTYFWQPSGNPGQPYIQQGQPSV